MRTYTKEKARQELMVLVWDLAERLGPIAMWELLHSVALEYERDVEELAGQELAKQRANAA